VDLRPYVVALAGYEGRTWTARDVALVRSELGKGDHRRPRYQTVSTFGLGP
jgi:2'-5' RNA ligase